MMTAMRNDQIAQVFDEIADMLELRDDNFYHKRAYRVAAEGLRDYPAQKTALNIQ
jgi:DNA polymerase/3'-5' exonuclease PolX